MDDLDQKTKTNEPSGRIIIRISDSKPQPSPEHKVNDLATAIDATTGQAVRSRSNQKMAEESARKLWRLGTDPDKLEFAINQSSVTLNDRDKRDLLKIND